MTNEERQKETAARLYVIREMVAHEECSLDSGLRVAAEIIAECIQNVAARAVVVGALDAMLKFMGPLAGDGGLVTLARPEVESGPLRFAARTTPYPKAP
jgi:hypothetical protein